MKNLIPILLALLISCKGIKKEKQAAQTNKDNSFTIAFGSCNNQSLPNPLWEEILKNGPDLWVWGGDIIYADTDNMKLMESYYMMLKNNKQYSAFSKKIEVTGTWDDHDYGLNDGGLEFAKKDSAQQLLLDFLEVDKNDSRRKRNGVYHAKVYPIGNKSIKVIVLDTRYFRSPLTEDPSKEKRYIPNSQGKGTILGETQWRWLEEELNTSEADFNILVSSIQFLSDEHGFETWGNMPHEVAKLKKTILSSTAQRVLLLSGDRHISEISSENIDGLKFPLIDFTASGLTHTYESYSGEPNPYRISEVIFEKNFGLVKFDLETNLVSMEIRGKDNLVLEKVIQQY